jgi:type I restriction enzyme S subunit
VAHRAPRHIFYVRFWRYLCLPPLGEQEADRSVSSRTIDFDVATARLEREIELLREYRTRLIADVVTGKLDVRAAAAQLPVEAPLDTSAELAGEMLDDAGNLDEVEAEEI